MIGYVLGGLAVALMAFSVWGAARGGGVGMVPLLLGFALLLAAMGMLGSEETRV